MWFQTPRTFGCSDFPRSDEDGGAVAGARVDAPVREQPASELGEALLVQLRLRQRLQHGDAEHEVDAVLRPRAAADALRRAALPHR